MKKCFMWFLICAAAAAVAACSKAKEQPEPAAAPEVNVQLPVPAPAKAPAVAPEIVAATPPAGAVQSDGSTLSSSTWIWQDFTLTFKDASTMNLKSSAFAALAPNGIDVPYVLKEGKFEVSGGGQKYTGTFDGNTLIIEGKAAVRQQ